MNVFAMTCVAALMLPSLAVAEELPKPVAALEALVGEWKGQGTMATPEGTATVQASWSCRRVSARFGVSCNLRVTGIPNLASYDETDLMGYEPNTDTYHWYSVTNVGETHDHVASHQPSEFVFEGTQAGQPLKEVIQLSLAGRTVRGRAETFVAGASVSVLTLELHKGKP
ncbi:MAG TPA: hypothetical protein VI299_01715 [Polyangiales bacterium]